MFNWFRKPAVVVSISRATGEEESANVSVNVFGTVSREKVFVALQECGEALRDRLVYNNQIVLQATESQAKVGTVNKPRSVR